MDDDRLGTAAPPGARGVASAPAAASGWPASDRVAAFSVFYRAELAGVVSLMILQGATIAEAADAAQTAMMQAWCRWDQLVYPRAWVRKVAYFAYLKSIPRHGALAEASELLALATDLAPEVALEISEGTETVRRLLAVLPAQQRLVMAWSMDGFTDEEIAHAIGTTPASVRQSRRRARQSLKQQLTDPRPGGDA